LILPTYLSPLPCKSLSSNVKGYIYIWSLRIVGMHTVKGLRSLSRSARSLNCIKQYMADHFSPDTNLYFHVCPENCPPGCIKPISNPKCSTIRNLHMKVHLFFLENSPVFSISSNMTIASLSFLFITPVKMLGINSLLFA